MARKKKSQLDELMSQIDSDSSINDSSYSDSSLDLSLDSNKKSSQLDELMSQIDWTAQPGQEKQSTSQLDTIFKPSKGASPKNPKPQKSSPGFVDKAKAFLGTMNESVGNMIGFGDEYWHNQYEESKAEIERLKSGNLTPEERKRLTPKDIAYNIKILQGQVDDYEKEQQKKQLQSNDISPTTKTVANVAGNILGFGGALATGKQIAGTPAGELPGAISNAPIVTENAPGLARLLATQGAKRIAENAGTFGSTEGGLAALQGKSDSEVLKKTLGGALTGAVAGEAGQLAENLTKSSVGNAFTKLGASETVAKNAGNIVGGVGRAVAEGTTFTFGDSVTTGEKPTKEGLLTNVGAMALLNTIFRVGNFKPAEQKIITEEIVNSPNPEEALTKIHDAVNKIQEDFAINKTINRETNFNPADIHPKDFATVAKENNIDMDQLFTNYEKELGYKLGPTIREAILKMDYVPPTKNTPGKTLPTPEQKTAINNVDKATPAQNENSFEPLMQKNKPSNNQVNNTEGKRGFINTVQNSSKTSEEFGRLLEENPNSTYERVTNKAQVEEANKNIQNMDEAYRTIMTAKKASANDVVLGHRLIDEYSKAGEIEKAVDVAERLAELGTKAGQSIQAYSVYNRLTPEGILVHAQRTAKRVNEKLPLNAKQVEVTNEMAAKLTDLATTMQNVKSTEKLSNSVIDIMDKAKSGQKLTEQETQQIKQFINEASKYVGKVKEFKPKKIKPVDNPRVRDNLVNFFDAQEAKALERINARKNRVSSMPVDLYADWAIVGASRLAKGAVKFADWSESMVKTVGEDIVPHLEDIYNKAVDLFNKRSQKKISVNELSNVEKITEKAIKHHEIGIEEAEQLREIAYRISKMSGDVKTQASQDLQSILQELDRPTIGQKISAAQTIAQLLNAKTMARNIIGNELYYRVEQINRLIAAPFDWGISKFTGKRAVSFIKSNQGQYWSDWINGWRAGWKGVNPEGLTTQYDIKGQVFSSKWNPLTYLEKVMGASLKSFDYASYKRVVRNTINEIGGLEAKSRGLKGENTKKFVEQFARNADENIIAIAEKYGQEATFQDVNAVSSVAVKIKRMLNLGKDFGAGDLILKYPKTPANLLMRSLEYSPAGILRSAKILSNARFDKLNQRELTLSLSRAVFGTIGFTGMGLLLARKGVLTGYASKDNDVKSLEDLAGKSQYQANISAIKRFISSGFNPDELKRQKGDTLINYDWVQPLAISIALGVNLEQASKEKQKTKGEVNSFDLGVKAAGGSLNTIVEQSFLQGLKKTFDFQPNQNILEKGIDISKDTLQSFVPTALKQVRDLTDNTRRTTSGSNVFEEMINRAKNKIPGVSKSLPADYGPFGETKEVYQNKSNNIFNVFANPAFVSKYNPSTEAQFILDLIANTGDESIAPRNPQKTLTIKGERYRLTPKQYMELKRTIGQETKTQIRNILNTKATDEQKVKMVIKVLDNAGEKSRNKLKNEIKNRGG